VVYGLGLGLTSAPATESIMGAVPRAKAGVGSAINDSTRLIGGTLGVAVIGSVYASVYAARLTAALPAALPAPAAAAARQSVGAAYAAAGQLTALGHPALGQALQHASTSAFLRGLTIGALVAGGVAAFGALLAVLFLPAQPATPAAYQAETAGQAHDSQTHTRPSTTATSRRPEITHATQAGTTCWSIWPRPGLAGPPRPRPGRCAYEARWHSCHHPGRRRAVLSCVLPGRLR
jgi:hypothetical protein